MSGVHAWQRAEPLARLYSDQNCGVRTDSSLRDAGFHIKPLPLPSKNQVCVYIYMVSMIGIVIMILGISSVFECLDPRSSDHPVLTGSLSLVSLGLVWAPVLFLMVLIITM